MAYKKTVIQVPRGAVDKIAENQNCGKTTVYSALNYTSNSESAKHIRHIAMSLYGGVEVKKVYL